MADKLTLQQVQKRFECKNYTLLSSSYENIYQKLYYKCSCGETDSVSLGDLGKRVGCKSCSPHKHPISLEEVKSLFGEYGYILLSTVYTNRRTPLEYICRCGSIARKSVKRLDTHHHCHKCKPNTTTALTIDDIRLRFKNYGFVLISDIYVNNETKLKFLCHCGEVGYCSVSNLRQSTKGCGRCSGPNTLKYLSPELQSQVKQSNRIKLRLASRIRVALKSTNNKKTCNTMDYIGCSISDLKSYISNKFTEGMTWENYGSKGWHIDHILPCASFDLTDPEQQKKCFHFTNLQPLWAKENLSKGSKLPTGLRPRRSSNLCLPTSPGTLLIAPN